jgi:5-methyltetrahydrofolate--homocysteine methyltransferase
VKTTLRSGEKSVVIDTEGPFVIIGERINPTGRKKLGDQLMARNTGYVRDLALGQVAVGADILDINVGMAGVDEVVMLKDVLVEVKRVVDVPLCIDTANVEALAAALSIMAPGKPLVNSVNGGDTSLGTVLPIVRQFGTAVIGLAMDDNGISNDPEVRLSIASRIVERAAMIGIPEEDVIIDPLVLSVGTDSDAGVVSLQTIELVRRSLGVNVVLGASNVSFGLPDRRTLNRAFLGLAIGAGATCAITDPLSVGLTVRAIDLLRGRDSYAARYINLYRSIQQRSE